MNILVTGSSGFFGNEIVRGLNSGSIFTLNRNIGSFQYDLCRSIPDFDIDFDFVIHNAGKAHILPKTKTEENSFFLVNTIGTKNLLQGLERSVPKYFVFISTVAVYGKECGTDISENEKLHSKDPYGLSKIQAERLIMDWCKINKVTCTILRLPLIIGRNPPGNLGAMVMAIQRGYYFNIGGGIAKKSMVLAEDVARFIPIIAPVGGTYNLTDGYHPSLAEFSFAIAKKHPFNVPITIAKIIGYIGDVFGDRALLNSFKLKKLTSDLTFDDSLARAMGWRSNSILKYLKCNSL